jgi:hypothetical protein
LAKSACSPFLRAYYWHAALRYLSSEGELINTTGHFLDGLRFLLAEEVAAGITADPATTPVAISLAPNTPALPRGSPSPLADPSCAVASVQDPGRELFKHRHEPQSATINDVFFFRGASGAKHARGGYDGRRGRQSSQQNASAAEPANVTSKASRGLPIPGPRHAIGSPAPVYSAFASEQLNLGSPVWRQKEAQQIDEHKIVIDRTAKTVTALLPKSEKGNQDGSNTSLPSSGLASTRSSN